MPELAINYLAVVVAALATIIIGAFWYSPLLFGNLWLKANGYTDEKLEQMKQSAGRAYLVSLACYLVMALVIAILASRLGVTTVVQGMYLGFGVWIGFLATLGLTAHMFSEKPLAIYLIDAGYQLAYALSMGAILAAWQ